MKENNNILVIQDFLMREMKRLDDNEHMKYNGKDEVARCNALSQSANTFIKSINLGLRVNEVAKETEVKADSLRKELGVTSETEDIQ